MYQYDEVDHRIVRERVAQFRDQTRRYLAGELSEDEFRPLRLMNGLYVQRHAPMLRVAIPYGHLRSGQLRKLADIARRYDKGYGHFTHPSEHPVQLAGTGQGAGYPGRTVHGGNACDPDLGQLRAQYHHRRLRRRGRRRAVGSAALVRNHPSMEHAASGIRLPARKFKIAVSGSVEDRAATRVHDIGLHVVCSEAGEVGFRVMVGGGLGRTPIVGDVVRNSCPLRIC